MAGKDEAYAKAHDRVYDIKRSGRNLSIVIPLFMDQHHGFHFSGPTRQIV
jgi:hypothetical protein